MINRLITFDFENHFIRTEVEAKHCGVLELPNGSDTTYIYHIQFLNGARLVFVQEGDTITFFDRKVKVPASYLMFKIRRVLENGYKFACGYELTELADVISCTDYAEWDGSLVEVAKSMKLLSKAMLMGG